MADKHECRRVTVPCMRDTRYHANVRDGSIVPPPLSLHPYHHHLLHHHHHPTLSSLLPSDWHVSIAINRSSKRTRLMTGMKISLRNCCDNDVAIQWVTLQLGGGMGREEIWSSDRSEDHEVLSTRIAGRLMPIIHWGAFRCEMDSDGRRRCAQNHKCMVEIARDSRCCEIYICVK